MSSYRFKTKCVAIVLFAVAFGLTPAFADPVPPGWSYVGTYQINYYGNTAGCPGPPESANPFYCAFGPGAPYFLAVAPGNYRIITVDFSGGGGNPRAFAGTASGGTLKILNPIIGDTVKIHVGEGQQLVLFQHDWVAWDNPPNIWLEAAVYRTPEPCSLALLGSAMVGLTALLRRQRRP